MKAFSNSKQIAVNLTSSIVSFLVSTGINFFLAPYLVKELGSEAYGFIGLANNFVQYGTILTSALNSMSGRFISIEYNKGNLKEASRFFSSVMVANMIMAGVMAAAALVITFSLDSFLDIPAGLEPAVKLTFGLTFVTFIISILTAIFTTAAFVRNAMHLVSIRDICANILKVVLVVGLFSLLPAKLYFLSIATLLSGVFLMIVNMSMKRKLIPEVKADVRLAGFSYVKKILSSGIWSSIGNLSNTLNTGLDLLICNLSLGAAQMGLLSISATVPHSISVLITVASNTFTPRFTILYAKNEKERLVAESKFSMKLVSLLMTTPLAGFIAFGGSFYTLWQPTKTTDEISEIQILSLLACLGFAFMSFSYPLIGLFTVCNKLRANVLVSLGLGIATVGIVLLMVRFTPLGIYAIAGVSSVLIALKSVTFVPLYSAHILKVRKSTFFPAILRGCLCLGVLLAVFFTVNHFVGISGWIGFILTIVACGIAGYLLSIPLILSRSEMLRLKTMIAGKLKKR